MKVLIDTDVLLDVLCNRKGLVDNSKKIWKYCEVKKIEGYVSALSIPNIVYVLRKELDTERIEEILEQLSLIFNIADLKSDDLKKAAALKFNDYEDALKSICATRIKAQYIVTGNIKDFKLSKVPSIKPSELIERIE